MKLRQRSLLAAAITFVSFLHADPAKESPAPSAESKKEAVAKHPLKGVIVDVLAERGGLLVKHEEIPGVMRAMTMLFKVDAETLKSAKKGEAITGLLSRESDGWHLTEVKPVAP